MPLIDALNCTHGYKERLGLAVQEELTANRVPGVRSRIAHPKAVKLGVRYIEGGKKSKPWDDLLESYPGRRFGNPQERAAHRNIKWLGAHAGSPEVLVYDIHNTEVPGLTFVSVGRRALKAALVGAWQLGYKKYCFYDSRFQQAVPNGLQLENGVPEAEFPVVARRLREGFGALALRSAAELSARYDEMLSDPDVGFYTAHYIRTTDDSGAIQPFIPSLEAVPDPGAFGLLDLSLEQRAALDIPAAASKVLRETWGHRNMSDVVPALGKTATGVPRLAWFGGYFLPAAAPTGDGTWVLAADIPGA